MRRSLRTLVVAVLFAALWGPALACGTERWSAKVLGDGTTLIDQIPTRVDVDYIRALPRPGGVDGFNEPRTIAELHDFRVQGELLGFKLEDDGDIHAVIAEDGNRGATLIAEIPDPRCMQGAREAYIREVARTRLAFIKRFGIPPFRSMRLAYAPIAVIGPPFFDFEHGQAGSSPNGAEIHPILGLEFEPATASLTGIVRSTPAARVSCPHETVVWVNTRTGIFHVPGTRYFGKTSHGAFMCRQAAEALGYRAARNKP